MPILEARSFLKKKLANPVEEEDVHGPVEQVIPMHFAAWRGADYAVLGIDHGE
jgi:hypothetical protein